MFAKKLQSKTVGYVYERHSCSTGCPVFADLRSQQLRHLSVVATEHLLQTQPERGGKVKVVNLPFLMFSTNRHQLTHDPSNGCCCYWNHFTKLMWDAGLLDILLAGVEDPDRTQELVQFARGSVVLPLRGEEKGWNADCCAGLWQFIVWCFWGNIDVILNLYETCRFIKWYFFMTKSKGACRHLYHILFLLLNATSLDVMCKQNKVKNSGWRFLQPWW